MPKDNRTWPEPCRCEYSYKGVTVIATKNTTTGDWDAYTLAAPTIVSSSRARAEAVRQVMNEIDRKVGSGDST